MAEHLARHVDWTPYYEEAESGVDWQWSLISKYMPPAPDLSTVLDSACGRGRIAQKFAEIATNLICVDIRKPAIDYCVQRFAARPNVKCLVSGESSLPVAPNSITFLYSWDSMVHFHQGELATYFKEFHRAMAPGAQGLIHHSNYGALTKEALPLEPKPRLASPRLRKRRPRNLHPSRPHRNPANRNRLEPALPRLRHDLQ